MRRRNVSASRSGCSPSPSGSVAIVAPRVGPKTTGWPNAFAGRGTTTSTLIVVGVDDACDRVASQSGRSPSSTAIGSSGRRSPRRRAPANGSSRVRVRRCGTMRTRSAIPHARSSAHRVRRDDDRRPARGRVDGARDQRTAVDRFEQFLPPHPPRRTRREHDDRQAPTSRPCCGSARCRSAATIPRRRAAPSRSRRRRRARSLRANARRGRVRSARACARDRRR